MEEPNSSPEAHAKENRCQRNWNLPRQGEQGHKGRKVNGDQNRTTSAKSRWKKRETKERAGEGPTQNPAKENHGRMKKAQRPNHRRENPRMRRSTDTPEEKTHRKRGMKTRRSKGEEQKTTNSEAPKGMRGTRNAKEHRKPKRLLTRAKGRTPSRRGQRFDRSRRAPRDRKGKGEGQTTTPNDRAHGNGGSQRPTEDKRRKTPGRRNTNNERKAEAHYRRIQRRAKRNGNQSQDK